MSAGYRSAQNPGGSTARTGWILFWLHLLVPALLLADSAQAWLRYGPSNAVKPVVLLCSLWLAAGLTFILLRRKQSVPSMLVSVLLVFCSGVLTIGVMEGVLEVLSALKATRSFYVPNSKFVFDPDPRYVPGVSGLSHFTINEAGLRAQSERVAAAHTNTYRMVAIGGSTTECLFLDDEEQWPALLMSGLNQRQSNVFAFVGNMGSSGLTTADHLRFLRYSEVQRANMWVFLFGINDLLATVAVEGAPSHNELMARAGLNNSWHNDLNGKPFFRRSELYQFVSNFRHKMVVDVSSNGAGYEDARHARQRGPRLPLADLAVGLTEYRARIRQIQSECIAQKKDCVFFTQPSLWRSDLTQEEERLLWMGVVGRKDAAKGFVPAAELARGMEQYNQALLHTCREQGMSCFDLAAAIPHSAEMFYDDCHFNENGARKVAEFMTQSLAKLPPFASAAAAYLRLE